MRRQSFNTTAETGGGVVTHIVNSNKQDVRGLPHVRKDKRAGHQESGELKKAAHYAPPFDFAIVLDSPSQMRT
jgi:hypothetical protein